MRRLLLPLLVLEVGATARAGEAPALQVEEWRLDNGLQVLFVADHKAPVVAVQVFYHAGGKDEPGDKRGIAHMFEHMMFKGSTHVPPEEHARYIQAVGGNDNAFTTEDVTGYQDTVPPFALEYTLQLEADRMRGLVLTQKTIDSEREVVKEELRLRVDNNPIGRAIVELRRAAYQRHPYRMTAAGEKRMLDTVTVEDCRKFYDTYYQPNNATLVVAGDTDAATLRRLVARYFGPLARGAAPPRVHTVEPPQAAERRALLRIPTQVPAVVGAYHIPDGADGDLYALEVLQQILSGGESSRLYQRLVRQDKLAVETGGFVSAFEDPGLFLVYGVYLPGGDGNKVLAAIFDELARAAAAPVEPAELTKAKNQLAARAVYELERVAGLATRIGVDNVIARDPRRALTASPRYEAVTAADVQRVAQKYLAAAGNRSVVVLEPPGPDGKTTGGDTGEAQRPAPATVKPAVAVNPWAGRSDLFTPPLVTPSTKVDLGAVERSTLPNGLHVVVVPRHSVPVVDVWLAVPAGHGDDDLRLSGLADLTAGMLRKGTRTRSADQIAQAIDFVGGALDAGADNENTSVSCHARARDLSVCLDLVADVTQNPVFPDGELAEVRDQALAAIQASEDNLTALAQQHANNLFWGNSDPRGRPPSLRSVRAIDAAALRAFHRRWYVPRGAVLAVSGDVDARALRAELTRRFGGWKGAAAAHASQPQPHGTALSLRLVDKPDATQSAIVVAGPGIARGDADYPAVRLVNWVLGGGVFSSRLMRVVRAEGGKTYSASSSFETGKRAGPFAATTSTRNAETGGLARQVLDEIAKLRTTGPTADEVAAARISMVGEYELSLETGADVAAALMYNDLSGLAPDFAERIAARLAAVTVADAARAAAAHLTPTVLVVAGKAAEVRPLLEKAGLKPGPAVGYTTPAW